MFDTHQKTSVAREILVDPLIQIISDLRRILEDGPELLSWDPDRIEALHQLESATSGVFIHLGLRPPTLNDPTTET